MDLNTLWFVLVGVLFSGYAILDGFDLGVGILHLLARNDQERRINLNAIGPVWDGNEVWLVTGGGALFAAFPDVYATAFSGFYIAFMLLLFGLIFRAVAIDFRSKVENKTWRRLWDWGFSMGSLLSSFIIGVAMGNIAWGVPIDEQGEFAGSFLGMLHPYAILLGLTTVALFAMHGSIYLAMKTDGDYQRYVRSRINPAIIAFIIGYAIFTIATLLYVPVMTEAIRNNPIFFVVVVMAILAIANIPREINRNRDNRAFISSCAAMILMMGLFGIGMYPNMIHSLPNPENSLTIYNASSSQGTLKIMANIALLGMPIVIAYTVSIYWIFRGKVKLDENSY
ncbi:cytochrome d ubiquinol oxidase subunit II [Pelagicoccus sp. SDUM812003]|uniref:cytochrome d ubiquinol oxidase subunit II n=1 Tax=Pelagicoccus sp. SDUM812003 TaxID=3041267 RepID=UPI00280D2310|nr:cytochrome d ubiquinol oxidase subunit II [Pelagicoccus sp. SDUM812003]MDQ8204517.1 cytochrome d ubiquinol oxidase subunit II [Pelagicoccus sp. SDUM812003]